MRAGTGVRSAVGLLLLVCGAGATASTPREPQHTVPVVMLSDLHFDPYRDPAKLSDLRSAEVSEWARILGEPASPTQADDYAALQKACHARGVDSSWAVVDSSLKAARKQESAPLFVTVSGDLLTHNFDCRLRTLVPSATADDVSKFAEKTVAFIALQLHQSFPGAPVYLALGNNDSGCANYRQSSGSEFLRDVEQSFATDISAAPDHPSGLQFDPQGDYSVEMPKPMKHARMIVMEDVFESPEYQDCSGNKGTDAAAAQISWLRDQLIAARQKDQHVWVMAHIPPGIDTYASFHKYVGSPEKLCTVTAPTMMLGSEALSDTLTEFADVVKLAVFAHTHMDEIKLLHNQWGRNVAAKLVPSVSPVNGNHPAFTVAEVRPQSAVLVDYAVYAAGDKDAGSWSEEYRYSTAYKKKDFSDASVAQLSASLVKDKAGDGELSRTYQKWFFAGDSGDYANGLRQIWPSYACAIAEDGGTSFHECMCPAETGPGTVKSGK